MSRFGDTLKDQNGAAIIGAKVYVYDNQTEQLVSLEDDDGNALDNPVTTDQYGNYAFTVDDGLYILAYHYGGRQILRREQVKVGEGPELPDEIVAALDNPTAAAGIGSTGPSNVQADLNARPTTALLAGSTGSAQIGYNLNRTGTVTRTWQVKGRETVSVDDFGAVGDGSTDNVAAFHAAIAAGRNIIVPAGGTYNLPEMVSVTSLGAEGGFGGRSLIIQAGATLTRTTGSSTEPLIWLRNSDCSLIGQGKASVITTTKRHPEGLVLIGHRNMTENENFDVHCCTVSDLLLDGKQAYGSTTGEPDVLLRICSNLLNGLRSSYFHEVHNLLMRSSNVGLHLLGDANASIFSGLVFWWIGNPTMSDPEKRCGILIEGGLENTIDSFWFHYSPGSSAIHMRNFDNTGVDGGYLSVPHYNLISGLSEQDVTPSGGQGLYVDAGCTGSGNRISIIDNCPGNTIPTAFLRANQIRLVSSSHSHSVEQMKAAIVSHDIGSLPTDRQIVALGIKEDEFAGRLKSIHEGTNWRDMIYEAKDHIFRSEGTSTLTIKSNRLIAALSALANAADDAAAATAGVPVGGLYRNGSVLMVRAA